MIPPHAQLGARNHKGLRRHHGQRTRTGLRRGRVFLHSREATVCYYGDGRHGSLIVGAGQTKTVDLDELGTSLYYWRIRIDPGATLTFTSASAASAGSPVEVHLHVATVLDIRTDPTSGDGVLSVDGLGLAGGAGGTAASGNGVAGTGGYNCAGAGGGGGGADATGTGGDGGDRDGVYYTDGVPAGGGAGGAAATAGSSAGGFDAQAIPVPGPGAGGGGGGANGAGNEGGAGGNGGGVLYLAARLIRHAGKVTADGAAGEDGTGTGGAGGGGGGGAITACYENYVDIGGIWSAVGGVGGLAGTGAGGGGTGGGGAPASPDPTSTVAAVGAYFLASFSGSPTSGDYLHVGTRTTTDVAAASFPGRALHPCFNGPLIGYDTRPPPGQIDGVRITGWTAHRSTGTGTTTYEIVDQDETVLGEISVANPDFATSGSINISLDGVAAFAVRHKSGTQAPNESRVHLLVTRQGRSGYTWGLGGDLSATARCLDVYGAPASTTAVAGGIRSAFYVPVGGGGVGRLYLHTELGDSTTQMEITDSGGTVVTGGTAQVPDVVITCPSGDTFLQYNFDVPISESTVYRVRYAAGTAPRDTSGHMVITATSAGGKVGAVIHFAGDTTGGASTERYNQQDRPDNPSTGFSGTGRRASPPFNGRITHWCIQQEGTAGTQFDLVRNDTANAPAAHALRHTPLDQFEVLWGQGVIALQADELEAADAGGGTPNDVRHTVLIES